MTTVADVMANIMCRKGRGFHSSPRAPLGRAGSLEPLLKHGYDGVTGKWDPLWGFSPIIKRI